MHKASDTGFKGCGAALGWSMFQHLAAVKRVLNIGMPTLALYDALFCLMVSDGPDAHLYVPVDGYVNYTKKSPNSGTSSSSTFGRETTHHLIVPPA